MKSTVGRRTCLHEESQRNCWCKLLSLQYQRRTIVAERCFHHLPGCVPLEFQAHPALIFQIKGGAAFWNELNIWRSGRAENQSVFATNRNRERRGTARKLILSRERFNETSLSELLVGQARKH